MRYLRETCQRIYDRDNVGLGGLRLPSSRYVNTMAQTWVISNLKLQIFKIGLSKGIFSVDLAQEQGVVNDF